VNDELERSLEEAAVTNFTVIPQLLPGGTEETPPKP
jgi:hypothetical protein